MPRPTTIHVREATVGDAYRIGRLSLELQVMDFNMRGDWFQHPDDVPAQHMYRELLREDNAVIYVAEVNGRFSGFAVAFAQYKFPTAQRRKQILINVDQIVVAASARRRGVGHALMKQVRTLAVLASADRITSSM